MNLLDNIAVVSTGRTRTRCYSAGVVLLMMVVSASSIAAGSDGVTDSPVGTATARALEMQRSGAYAGRAQLMAGDEANASYERYVKSFATPIPQFFGSSLKSDGSSGSGTTSGAGQ